MHVKIEANKSSRIEGTRTTVEEDLLDVTDITPEKRDDWEEVQNYVKATNYGVEIIKNGFPVCTRLIRELHKILMQEFVENIKHQENLEHHKTGLEEVCQVMLYMFHHHIQRLQNV